MITKEDIYKKVDRYLMENIGNLIGPGEPVFDNKAAVWRVPIFHMSNVAIFPLSETILNVSGEIVYMPTRGRLIEIAQQILKDNEEVDKFKEKMIEV